MLNFQFTQSVYIYPYVAISSSMISSPSTARPSRLLSNHGR